MSIDLRSYLDGISAQVFRPVGELSVVDDITALQHRLSARRRYPVVVVDSPRLPDGGVSSFPVVTNLFASRTRNAAVMDIDDPGRVGQVIAERSARTIPPVIVREGAPVHDVVAEGPAVDLTRLPILRQHEGDLGPYVTAGHCTTIDPETGIDNTSIQRCCLRGSRRLSFYPYPGSHNARNLEKFWARGDACPVAIWIGHHPRVSMAAQMQIGYPESHWAVAGGLCDAPIRLVPSRTFGERLMVPADAEIVIEGLCPPNVREADGPFGEYTGVMGPQIAAPVIDITCVSHRRGACYHDIGAGLEDHLVPDNMMMEARIWRMVGSVAPSLRGVHVPFSGRRFHVYLAFRDPRLGEARDALATVLGYRRIRTAIAVDDDLDLADDSQILWAVATRMTWGRDVLEVDGLTAPNLDPALPPGAATTAKVGIDATLPPAPGPGLPKPFSPRLSVGAAALNRARAILSELDGKEWPRE